MPQFSFGQVINVTGPNNGFQGTVSRFGERVIMARQFIPYTATNNLNFGDPAVILPGVGNGGGAVTSVADLVGHSAAGIALVASAFAGMAVREVKTQLTYPAGQQPGIQQVGYYANEQMSEVLERGNGTILLSVGAPLAEAQVYTRVVLNGAVPAGVIGDWETNPAATDLFSTTATAAAIGTAVTLASAANTQNGQVVTGFGIAPGSYIVSGGGTTAIVLNQNTTAIIPGGTPITLSNLVALPNVVARTGHLDSNNILEITIKVRNAA
jgi:hypothetical protein